LATDGNPTHAAARFLSWLQTTNRNWLMVLDDVADPADLRGLWPDPTWGQTLVTTRRSDPSLIIQGRRRVEVGLFSPAEARIYLAAKLAGTDPSQADELAADVGYLPLALAQAASFILNQGETCAAYRTRLADRRERLEWLFPDDAPADEYHATVAATWSISIEAADQLHPRGLAAPLLRVLSMLDPNGFPSDILTTDAVTGLLTTTCTSENGAVSGRDCQDVARNLARLSLLTLTQPNPGESGGFSRIRVHALVQRAATEQLTPDQIASLVRAAADALDQAWPVVVTLGENETWRANATTLVDRQVDALWEPDYHPVLVLSGRTYADYRRLLGPDHPVTLYMWFTVAYQQAVEDGDPAGAASMIEELLADYLRVLGPDHRHTLGMRARLEHFRAQAGDPGRAAAACEELLADYLRVLGPDHTDTLTTRLEIAHFHGEAGDPARAATALEQLLIDYLRVLGSDHPHTLATRNSLAYWRGRATDS
jgi:hypothetical protein